MKACANNTDLCIFVINSCASAYAPASANDALCFTADTVATKGFCHTKVTTNAGVTSDCASDRLVLGTSETAVSVLIVKSDRRQDTNGNDVAGSWETSCKADTALMNVGQCYIGTKNALTLTATTDVTPALK